MKYRKKREGKGKGNRKGGDRCAREERFFFLLFFLLFINFLERINMEEVIFIAYAYYVPRLWVISK